MLFIYSCFETKALESQLESKIVAKFHTFDPSPVKLKWGVGEMTEWILRDQPKTKPLI